MTAATTIKSNLFGLTNARGMAVFVAIFFSAAGRFPRDDNLGFDAFHFFHRFIASIGILAVVVLQKQQIARHDSDSMLYLFEFTTILIGSNAGGKSNALDALLFLNRVSQGVSIFPAISWDINLPA